MQCLIQSAGSINHAEITVVFVTPDHIPFLLNLAPRVPNLKLIVSLHNLSAESKTILDAWGKEKNIQVINLLERMHMLLDSPIRLAQTLVLFVHSGGNGHCESYRTYHANAASACDDLLHVCKSTVCHFSLPGGAFQCLLAGQGTTGNPKGKSINASGAFKCSLPIKAYC